MNSEQKVWYEIQHLASNGEWSREPQINYDYFGFKDKQFFMSRASERFRLVKITTTTEVVK